MRLGFLGLSLAGIAAAVPSPDPGFRIVTRETLAASVIETIDYIEADRARTEWRTVPTPSAAPGAPLAREELALRSARISRCDLQKIIMLNYDERTHMTAPLRSDAEAVRNLRADLAAGRGPAPKPPNLLIETTTVQTGERKYAFGYTARRAITTRRDIPLDANGEAQSVIETDGWYIDLETRPSCERVETVGVRAVLLAATGPPNKKRRPDMPIVTFKDIGAPERGYPIETRTTARSMLASSNGGSSEHTIVTHKVVTQLSRERLDPSLFEIPHGFRAADGRLAAFAAYWRQTWDTIKAAVARFFR